MPESFLPDKTADLTSPGRRAWPRHYSLLLLVLATSGCLLPFLNKAIHIDDPVYLWTAQQIAQHPLDPFGFRIVWYDTEAPLADISNNPPISSYYAAAWGRLFGWSEPAMHLAFFFPALAVVLCTYRLAGRFTRYPFWTALLTLFAPGFLVSGTTLMCDVLMLAFWIAAVMLWLDAIDSGNPALFLASATLAAACALTKFFGIALILLLPFYSLLRRRLAVSFAYVGIPVFFLALYERWMRHLYGPGTIRNAVQYASLHNQGHQLPALTKGIITLSFAGGCMLPALLLLPLLWSRRWIAAQLFGGVLVGVAVARHWIFLDAPRAGDHWGLLSAQLAIFVVGGLSVLALTGLSPYERRGADSMLLALWILGALVFSGFVNWAINARAVLPIIPAVAILIVQRLERAGCFSPGRFPWKLAAPLVASGALSLAIAWSDARLANSARDAATVISSQFRDSARPMYFEGHWGFQYYMQRAGAQPTDIRKTRFQTGDLLVIPENTTNSFGPPPGFQLADVRILPLDLPQPLATMSQPLGAGFYASVWGPLPFAIGPVPPERYMIARLVPLPGNTAAAPMILK